MLKVSESSILLVLCNLVLIMEKESMARTALFDQEPGEYVLEASYAVQKLLIVRPIYNPE